ncbi:MAG: YncE family protein [Thermomicrobiales bacterium]
MTARRIIFSALRHAALTPPGRVLLLGCLVIALAAPAAAKFPASPARPAAPGVELYVSNPTDDPAGQRLTPLDPRTLADRTDAAVIELGSVPSFWYHEQDQDPFNTWIPSADGSTLLGVEYATTDVIDRPLRPDEMTFVVRDGRTGFERARFHPPGEIWPWPPLILSRDGSRLVIEGMRHRPETSGGEFPRWYVVDTKDGRLVSTLDATAPEHWGSWLDPAGRRLYYLAAPRGLQSTTPWPVRIVAHDLTTGDEVARVVLADVPFGVWETAQDQWAEARPGLALSPDGRQLAVVHPDRSAVVLIETERFTVERTVVLRQPASRLDRLVGLLPLVPRDAAAKSAARMYVGAAYGPDGRRLYLHWREDRPDDAEEPRRLGLAVVDLASGTILAESPLDDDSWVQHIMPAPDGRSVYVYVGSVLQRHDASTLKILAERRFVGFRWFVLRPLAPDG